MTVTDIAEKRALPNVAPTGRAAGARGIKSPVTSAVLDPNPNVLGAHTRLYQQYAPLAYNLPWTVLDAVELLSTYNADYSQAVDNIRSLANSTHELYVAAGTDLATRKIKVYLEEIARTTQESFGGMDGMIDKLLDQAAVYGAMCGEWVIDDEMGEVVDFADINPKKIRFYWDFDNHKYAPFQKVTAFQAQEARDRGQAVLNGAVQLNEATFHYYAFDPAPQSPYGTPPFIAALEPIGIQRDMVANMSQIVKKIGLLGVVDLVVKQLPPKPGESDEAYASRASAYLDEYVSAAEDMVRDGGLVHFDDVELKTTTIGGNAAGATNIFKQNEELVFSGLKSMPSVQGRSYSTTETYAGVAYDIIIRNTQKYQRACKRMVERGYWLACAMKGGMNPSDIQVNFKENKTLHRLQNAQSETIEIKNSAKLWKAGVINQTGFALRLGYADVDTHLDEVPIEVLMDQSTERVTDALDATGGGKADNQNNTSGEQSNNT